MSLQLGSQAPNFTQKSSLGDIHFYEYIEDSGVFCFLIPKILHLYVQRNWEQWPNTYRILQSVM